MTRLPDWEPRLAAVLATWADRPHGWQATCADLAADVVEAVTGRDMRRSIGLPVRSAREAACLFRRVGAATLADAVTTQLGPPVGRRRIGCGDIVEALADMALGVCVGDRVVFVGDVGTVVLPMAAAARGWKL